MKTRFSRRALFLSCLFICIILLASCNSPRPTSTTIDPATTPPVSTTETALPPGVLSPGKIDSTMASRVVKVRGEVQFLVLDPDGNGGAYIDLGDDSGKVGLRIEADAWDGFSSQKIAEFTVGNTVTVEGMLVLAGEELVIVYGLIPPATDAPRQENATFIVKVPVNTRVSYAVFMELVDEQKNLFGFVKMEQQDEVTWQVSIPSGPQKFGYRYTRDGTGYPTAEEFTPDSKDTYRWPEIQAGMTYNDTVNKWRWVPGPEFVMPVIPSEAGAYNIVKRINDEEFQCGYGFVDFWWEPFHDLAYGSSIAMKEAGGTWIKISPPIGFSQVEPLPVMNWDVIPDNPIYPEGELEYHIAQAQKAGLNVFLVPQYGVLTPEMSIDGSKQYSAEWWAAFYAEVERFSIYFADLAERCGVQYLAVSDIEIWNSSKAPVDVREKFAEHVAVIREHYSGNLGMTGSLNAYDPPDEIYLNGYYPELFDFFAVGGPVALADNNEPTVAELKEHFRAIIEAAVEPLYTQYGKPIILHSAGYPSLDGAAMHAFIHDDPPMDVFEQYSNKYRLDLEEQALIYEAIMQVIAEKPYITGFYLFNSHWPTPLPFSKLYTVWGKPAEQILAGWYERFSRLGR